MSIVAHLPRPDPLTGSRVGGDAPIDCSQPPTVLLPDGGNLAPAPASTPERVLARDAIRLIRLIRLEEPSGEIGVIRRQLGPIRSRRALAASYGREAVNRPGSADPDASRTVAVRLAYALRWLELGPDRR